MARHRLPADERKRQIARVVLEIVAERGAQHLTASEIARRVGVSDAALFRHFGDKSEIVDAAIETFERLLFEDFPPVDPDPLERLRRLFVQRVTLVRRYPEIMRLAFNDRLAEAAGGSGARRVRSIVERSVAFVSQCLAEAKQRQLVPPSVSLEVLLWTILGVIRGAALDSRKRRASPEALWKELEQLLRGAQRAH
jgi:AcrR family transcriptional regulator